MDRQKSILIFISGLLLLTSLCASSQESPEPVIISSTSDSEIHPSEFHLADTFRVGIKGLRDINLRLFNPKHGLRGSINFCIFSGSGAYRLTLSNQAQDGQFYLQLEQSRFKLPMDIYFNDQEGQQGHRMIREGVMLSGLMSRNRQPACQTVNANLSIVISPSALEFSVAGSYHGWFFLEISPE